MSESNILRLGAGNINAVNDLYIGTTGVPNGGPLRSHFAGQLGKVVSLDDDNIVYDSSVGTVYGGQFQYVRLSASATTPLARGQIVFWDPTVAPNLFQVTTPETVSTPDSTLFAGIVLNPSWTAGYYSLIQLSGLVYVKFKASLTTAGAVGCPVYAATAGGSDNGLANVITTDATAAINATFLGRAYDIPTGGSTVRVWLTPTRNA